MITVVDYGRGNLFSIEQALRHLGCTPVISSDPDVIRGSEKVILPGVGAFGDAMRSLEHGGLTPVLREVGRSGRPLLGICLGMQLLADFSEEFGHHQGLGLIGGVVRRLPETDAPGALRVPNVGWRHLIPQGGSGADRGGDARPAVYFVHSYAFRTADPADTAATIDFNGEAVTAIVARGAVTGFQFHPEKSGKAGLDLIRRFLDGRVDWP